MNHRSKLEIIDGIFSTPSLHFFYLLGPAGQHDDGLSSLTYLCINNEGASHGPTDIPIVIVGHYYFPRRWIEVHRSRMEKMDQLGVAMMSWLLLSVTEE